MYEFDIKLYVYYAVNMWIQTFLFTKIQDGSDI